MRKNLFILVGLILVAFGLSACGGDAQSATPPASVNGSYSADNFTAKVTDDSIVINLSLEGSEGLYWVGTFENASKVTSEADTEALSSSLYGSQDATKEFTIKGDTISFKFTAMGVTKTIDLKKD